MRVATMMTMALLLAGCGQRPAGDPPPAPAPAPPPVELVVGEVRPTAQGTVEAAVTARNTGRTLLAAVSADCDFLGADGQRVDSFPVDFLNVRPGRTASGRVFSTQRDARRVECHAFARSAGEQAQHDPPQ